MKWEVASLFATPVFKFHFEDIETAKALFSQEIKTLSGEPRDQQGELVHFHSKTNVFSLYPQLAALKTQVEDTGTFVYKELLNYQDSGDVKVTNAWYNLCEIGGVQPAHSHVNCLLCGTLYLNADENSEIRFYHPQGENPNHSELYDKESDKANQHGLRFHRRQSKVPVRTGDCLFWPSWLKHGYPANQTPQRLSLSFNMMPSRLNVDYQPFPS